MITGQLSAELSATCSSLGHYDGLKYNVDPYCRESIKDLIRYLRRDSEDHAVRRFLGSTKILKTDLVPILIHHSDDDELFDVVLRLVMNLMTPALIVYQEQIPSDKTERNRYLQLISQLQDGKMAFTEPDVWNVLGKNIGKLLETESYERDEDTSRTMERILILARNVLAVPSDAEYEKRPDNDATVHDKVLWAMHKSRMDEIFLYIASSEKEQQVYMHILEIISLMLREQNPSTLAKSEVQRSFSEKEKDEEELLAFRQAEIRSKQMKVKKYAGARHGHFGGTYVMMGVKAAGDNDLIFHKPLDKAVSMEFNFEKRKFKRPKNLQPLKQVSEERKSTFGVRLFLKEFCVDLLNGAYNPLMKRVKEIIERGRSNGDESYYFWAMKFFMEFNRSYNFQVKLVSETVSIETFHFIQTQLENWNDLMTTDKKKIPLWSRRMHLALNAYQELLLTLAEMDRSADAACRGSSQVLKSRVFYVTEYRDLLVILTHLFKENRFSKMYMKDLIETVHIFMKMLQKFSEKHRGGLVVQQKKRTVQKRKKSDKKKSAAQEANMESIWDQVGPQLSAVLQGDAHIPTDIVPFDATSDLGMEEQKVEAMKRIQALLKNGDFEEALGLLRSAREVWPENNCFGTPDMMPEDEFMAVRDIFMADLGQQGAADLLQHGAGRNGGNEEDDNEEEEYGDEPAVGYQESELKFDDFVRRFISEKTLQICGILLSKFEENSAHTNHCVVKLLHRIAVDCRMPAMVFQATLFRTFQRAMNSPNPEHKDLRRFGRFIVQKFIEVAVKNTKVYIEILFWKKVKDAIEIVDGYGTTETKSQSVKNMWTEEQEDELTRLFHEFMCNNPAESNPVDWIMQNLINQDRSRYSVIKKLKKLNLWTRQSVAEMKRSAREWTQDEEEQLKELVPHFLNAENPMECIMNRIMGNRTKNNVVRKILDLGLVTDRKQLRKKRARKSGEIGENMSDGSSSSDEGSSSEDEMISKDDTRPTVVNIERIVESLNNAVSAGFKEPLEWLVSSLAEMIEDLGSEDQEDVPLLPLTESCTLAMENATFLAVIKSFGMKSPDDQEIYWRIPGNWNEMKIRENMKLIGDAIEGKLTIPSEEVSSTQFEGMEDVENQETEKEEKKEKNKEKMNEMEKTKEEKKKKKDRKKEKKMKEKEKKREEKEKKKEKKIKEKEKKREEKEKKREEKEKKNKDMEKKKEAEKKQRSEEKEYIREKEEEEEEVDEDWKASKDLSVLGNFTNYRSMAARKKNSSAVIESSGSEKSINSEDSGGNRKASIARKKYKKTNSENSIAKNSKNSIEKNSENSMAKNSKNSIAKNIKNIPSDSSQSDSKGSKNISSDSSQSDSKDSKSSDSTNSSGSSDRNSIKRKGIRKRAESRRLMLDSDSDDDLEISIKNTNEEKSAKSRSIWHYSDSDSKSLRTHSDEEQILKSNKKNGEIAKSISHDPTGNSQNKNDSPEKLSNNSLPSTSVELEGTQGSLSDSNLLKRKRSENSTSDLSDLQESPGNISRKGVKSRRFVMASSSSEEDNKTDTSVMSVEDENLTYASKSLNNADDSDFGTVEKETSDVEKKTSDVEKKTSDVGTVEKKTSDVGTVEKETSDVGTVEKQTNKPKRKRIILESDSDSDN